MKKVLLGLVALVLCTYANGKLLMAAEAGSTGVQPTITNFKISPNKVTDSSIVTFSFDFENLAGGMKDATFSLEYEGSISMNRRSSRLVGRLERAQERKWSDSDATSGHFRAKARYRPRGEPPYTTTYFIKICAGNGQCSKEASADIDYVY
ncbi:MAG: hypothetical protein IIA72_23715 [Proteobacteria bacterium]|nr:hypothetical protein [Pseudomonadota bacterium]